MVVISIIALFASIITSQINNMREKARDTLRMSNMSSLQNALELYYADHGQYPKTFDGAFGAENRPIGDQYCECCSAPRNTIPGLVPTYIKEIPKEPTLFCGQNALTHGWYYGSDGNNYKFMTHGERSSRFNIDPVWDGFQDNNYVTCPIGANPDRQHVAIWSEGARCWRI